MKKSTTATITLILGLWFGTASVHAEDIDIFSGGTANGSTPNILILIDTAASNDASFSSPACPISGIPNSKLMDQVQCALAVAVDGIRGQNSLLDKLNIGLMEYGAQNNQGGAWVSPSSPPTSLPNMDLTGISNFVALVQAGYPKSNSRGAPSVMQEAWAFFTGKTGASGVSYANHVTLSCQKSFIIFIGAAAKQGKPAVGNGNLSLVDTGSYTVGATAAQKVPINTSNLGSGTGDDDAWSDEWARFLFQTDFGGNLNDKQNVVTYTIAATGGDPNADYVQHLKSMASQGGGKSFVGSNVSSMTQALLQIFNEVAAVNSVFASVSLPISANIQGTYANQIYIGMFRPDGFAQPRWTGNLKQYQFGVDNSNPSSPQLFLADSTGAKAISAAGTGFISPTAVSFWTSKNTSALPDNITPDPGFWRNNPQGSSGGFDLEDGEIVEKGGVGQRIRMTNLTNNSPRNVYTCVGSCTAGSSLSASPFATTNANLTAASFGITAPTNAISSISRNGTTVTITLSASPNPALTNGQNVTIQGSAYPEINGNFTIALVNATTFTYTITESPPTPATGTYTATLPSTPKDITSLVRGGGANPGTTVTATSAGHGYMNGDTITISGASGAEYNGPFTISGVTANTFQYTISDNPPTTGTGGTATVGASSATIAASGISRVASSSALTAQVTVTATANLPPAFGAGGAVSITGATPTAYNVTNKSIIAGGQNGACGVNGSAGKKVFCFSINTTPASPDPGASKKADRAGSVAISSLAHPAACTGGSPTPNAVVTATTAASHPFVTGDVVSIGGNPVGANESAYVGNFAITKVNNTTFTYSVTTSPALCSPSASGVTAATTTGGIDKNSLINWVRGEDNVGDERSPGSGITIRPSVHGDILHSRPTVINYGSTGVVVFYGSNDGVFRAVNGNQSGNIGGVPPGGEMWSFIPSEFFTKLSRLYLNSPTIKLFSTPTGISPTPTPKDYYFDGVTGVYQNTSAGKAYLYLSARRGGRRIYAIDASDPTDPRFMWKMGCPNMNNNTGCTSGFAELGQSWSAPKVALVKGNTNPVLIFGAGYHGGVDPSTGNFVGEDKEPPSTDTMGRGIFILDAVTGDKLWQAGPGGGTNTCTGTSCQLSDMTYAIAADVTLLDRDFDGKIDRLYAADTGGNIWRVDLEPTAGNAASSWPPSLWQVTKLAELGGTGTTKRKFLFPPDVVTTKHFDAVLAGTGDREHPVYGNQSLSIVNRFYMLKDTNIGKDASGWTTIVDSTSSTANTAPSSTILFDATSAQYPSTFPANGFSITLAGSGEKLTNGPTTIGGFTYFGTNTPTVPGQNSCNSGLGTAKGYRINFITGAGATKPAVFDGGGLPPSPVAGLVTLNIGGEDTTVPFLIGAGNSDPDCSGPDCRSPIGADKPPITISAVRQRLYWYNEKQDN